MKLAENIRRFRKERALTQEQLAEVFGVTVGAVYKWEAGMSVPELGLIVEMADFFDTSVDVLLGYEMKDNRPAAAVARMAEYRRNKDRAGLAEAEKALKKYPHDFSVVHESAKIYRVFGIENRDKALLRRALELQEESVLLRTQNTDPEIGETSLYGEIAEIYLALDEDEKGIELLKKHNVNGCYSDLIGLALADGEKRPEEAVPYLSEALMRSVSSLIQTVMGFVNVYEARQDPVSAREIVRWETGLLSGLKEEGKTDFLDKVNALFLTVLADTQLRTGEEAAARESLRRARSVAESFDAAPSYDPSAIRFVEQLHRGSVVSDDFGTTATDGIENTVKTCGNEALSALWQEIKGESRISL